MPFICHKTDWTPRAPLTRSVDLSLSNVPHRHVNHSTRIEVTSSDTSDFTSRSDRKWDAGERMTQKGLVHSSMHSLLWGESETEGRRRERLDRRIRWTALISGIRFSLSGGEYRRRRFIDCRSAIRRTLRWAAMEPAEFFDGAASADQCRFVETVVDVEAAAFTDDEPVYVMGRVMIAWRIVYFTRVARREVSSRAAFDPTPL